MPFVEVSIVSRRQEFVKCVLGEGQSIRGACLRFGVSRPTAYKWLARYEEEGEPGLVSRSRRPLSSPSALSEGFKERVLELKKKHPAWGAKKLAVLLGDGAPCSRTIDRFLRREGLVGPNYPSRAVGRFEKENCNELWQADHKGVPKGQLPVFGCVDDASRFCLVLEPVRDQSLDAFWEPLWDAFGTYGLPDAILTDNGVAFKNLGMKRPSSFDLRLMLLGIRPIHGRPYHPQTQGKIERFFGTLEREKPDDIHAFRELYNDVRPHEAILMKTPASCYTISKRKRPSQMPAIILPEGCITRATDRRGTFSYQGQHYRIGRAIAQTTIGIKQGNIYYGPANIGPINFYKL